MKFPRISMISLSLSVIAVLVLTLACLAEDSVSEIITPPAKPDGVIQVATYNIRGPRDSSPNDWNSRFPRMVQTIKENGFDIFGVQEGMKGAMNDLLSELDHFEWFGIGREKKKDGEHCAIFYNTLKFRLIEKGTFWLSDSPNTPGSIAWNAGCPRVCTWGFFEELKTRVRFYFVNTHLDNASALARSQGASAIIMHFLREIELYPFILTGDFNSSSADQPYLIVQAHGLTDSRIISETDHYGAGDETFHNFKVNRKERTNRTPIDFIFVNKKLRVLTHGTINDFRDGLASSDHFAVTAQIQLPEKKK